ncbi:LysR family transcriptional regulator [Nocardia sp. NPDC052566]|uniref:LysR family transcriptional regulator n=1 Tax=Nocardia sp. NPDC052566 TaxID=3364330 RepID=UPI0037C8FD6D
MDPGSHRAHERPFDLYRLEQFLEVAEQLSFTKAAQTLRITQQALSMAVRRLERQLGVTLFERTRRRVALTQAGITLRDGTRILLAASEALITQTRDAGGEPPHPYVIGHAPPVTADEVYRLLDPVRAALPEASVTAWQLLPDALVTAVFDGSVDLALRRDVVEPPGLACAVIARHQLRVAVGATHRLADREQLTVNDLRGERILVAAPPGASAYTDFLLGICRVAGFVPQVAVHSVADTPPLFAIAGNIGIAFVTSAPGPAHDGRVRVIALADAPQVPTQALWLPHTGSPLRNLLIPS